MSKYEFSFLMPNLFFKQREEVLKNLEEAIKKLNGKIEDKFIEKKFFAYSVKKQEEGFLGIINFSMEKEKIKELRNFLKLNKDLLKTVIENKEKVKEFLAKEEKGRKPILAKKQVKKVKIEELDKKLDEILK